MKKIILVSTLTGLLIAASANAQNLPFNGDFETSGFVAGQANTGGTNVPNWTATNDQGFASTAAGSNYVVAYGAEWQSDVFSITSNTDYVISGNVSHKAIDDEATFFLKFLDNAEAELSNVSFVIRQGAFTQTGETNFDFFTSDDATTNASLDLFGSLNSGAAVKAQLFLKKESGSDAVAFDNVSVSAVAVPEPSTYAMIAGFLAFGFVALRRRMAIK
jgi:hypothetical protein